MADQGVGRRLPGQVAQAIDRGQAEGGIAGQHCRFNRRDRLKVADFAYLGQGASRRGASSLAASCRRAVRRGSHFSLVTFQSCCCRSSAATWAGVR